NRDGTRLAANCGDGTVRVYDVTGIAREPLTIQTGGALCVAFSPDGKRLATTSGGPVQLWDTNTRQVIPKQYFINTYTVTSAAFSPDGEYLAVGGDGATVLNIGKTAKLRPSYNLGGLRGVYSVAYSPDGRYLVSAGIGGPFVWDATT